MFIAGDTIYTDASSSQPFREFLEIGERLEQGLHSAPENPLNDRQIQNSYQLGFGHTQELELAIGTRAAIRFGSFYVVDLYRNEQGEYEYNAIPHVAEGIPNDLVDNSFPVLSVGEEISSGFIKIRRGSDGRIQIRMQDTGFPVSSFTGYLFDQNHYTIVNPHGHLFQGDVIFSGTAHTTSLIGARYTYFTEMHELDLTGTRGTSLVEFARSRREDSNEFRVFVDIRREFLSRMTYSSKSIPGLISSEDILQRGFGCCRHDGVILNQLFSEAGKETRVINGLIIYLGAGIPIRGHQWIVREYSEDRALFIEPTNSDTIYFVQYLRTLPDYIDTLPVRGLVEEFLEAGYRCFINNRALYIENSDLYIARPFSNLRSDEPLILGGAINRARSSLPVMRIGNSSESFYLIVIHADPSNLRSPFQVLVSEEPRGPFAVLNPESLNFESTDDILRLNREMPEVRDALARTETRPDTAFQIVIPALDHSKSPPFTVLALRDPLLTEFFDSFIPEPDLTPPSMTIETFEPEAEEVNTTIVLAGFSIIETIPNWRNFKDRVVRSLLIHYLIPDGNIARYADVYSRINTSPWLHRQVESILESFTSRRYVTYHELDQVMRRFALRILTDQRERQEIRIMGFQNQRDIERQRRRLRSGPSEETQSFMRNMHLRLRAI